MSALLALLVAATHSGCLLLDAGMARPLSEKDWQAVIKFLRNVAEVETCSKTGQRSKFTSADVNRLRSEGTTLQQRLDAASGLSMPAATWQKLVKKQVCAAVKE